MTCPHIEGPQLDYTLHICQVLRGLLPRRLLRQRSALPLLVKEARSSVRLLAPEQRLLEPGIVAHLLFVLCKPTAREVGNFGPATRGERNFLKAGAVSRRQQELAHT